MGFFEITSVILLVINQIYATGKGGDHAKLNGYDLQILNIDISILKD